MRCFFSCAIKKEASSISFGDASHAYVKLLYARERVEMQAGRRGKAQQTFEYRLEHKSLLSIISKNYKMFLQLQLHFFESQSQIDVEFATDQKIDWDRCLHSIAVELYCNIVRERHNEILDWKDMENECMHSRLSLSLFSIL